MNVCSNKGSLTLDWLESSRIALNTALGTGSYTFGFLLETAAATQSGRYRLENIVREIAILEKTSDQKSSTKKETKFNGRILRGYWHKHHMQAVFMAHNILKEMIRDKTVEKFLKPYIGTTLTASVISGLAHSIAIENYKRISENGTLTGEWIVFSRQKKANIYLTLARHSEEDKMIFERIKTYEKLDQSCAWNCRASAIYQQSEIP